MPASAERKIAARGGATKWRTVKRDGKTFRVAVTRKEGPRGGKTVMYPIDEGSPAGGRGKKW
jgi:hypothetical protein